MLAGHTQVVDRLLGYEDVIVNIQDRDGWTALMLAAEKGREKVVDLLLRRKGVRKRQGDGQTQKDREGEGGRPRACPPAHARGEGRRGLHGPLHRIRVLLGHENRDKGEVTA